MTISSDFQVPRQEVQMMSSRCGGYILKHTNNWLAVLSGRASLIDDCLVARPAKAFSLSSPPSSPQAPPKVSWELLPLSGSSLPRPVFLLLTGP